LFDNIIQILLGHCRHDGQQDRFPLRVGFGVARCKFPKEAHSPSLFVQLEYPIEVTEQSFFLFIVAPLTLRFFLGFGDLIGVTCNWTFQKYISFVTTLMLVFGLAFQTPIAIFILNRTGLVSH